MVGQLSIGPSAASVFGQGAESVLAWFEEWNQRLAEAMNPPAILLATVAVIIFLLLIRNSFRRRYVIKCAEGAESHQAVQVALRSQITNELHVARKEADTLTRIDGAEADIPAPAVSLPDKFKWAEPVVNGWLGRRSLSVLVRPYGITDKKIEVQVELHSSSGQILEQRHFSQSVDKMTGVDLWEKVGTLIGAWLVFMLAHHSRTRRQRKKCEPVRIFESESWESYAFMRMASHVPEGSKSEKREWLNGALWEDHRNIKALVDLARLDMHDSDYLRSSATRKNHMEVARDLISDERRGFETWRQWEFPGARADLTWYQTTYALLGFYINRHCALMDYRSAAEIGRPVRADGEGPAFPVHQVTDLVEEQRAYEVRAQDDLTQALRLGRELALAVGATELTLRSRWRKWSIPRKRRRELSYLLNRDGADLATLWVAPMAIMDSRATNAHPEGAHDIARDWVIVDDVSALSIEEVYKLLVCLAVYSAPRGTPRARRLAQRLQAGLERKGLHFVKNGIGPDVTSEGYRPHSMSLLTIQEQLSEKQYGLQASGREVMSLKMRYQRACAWALLGAKNESVNELLQVFDHYSDVSPMSNRIRSSHDMLVWAKTDPTLATLRADLLRGKSPAKEWIRLGELIAYSAEDA